MKKIIVLSFLTLLLAVGCNNSQSNTAMSSAGTTWYYVNQDYQCVQAPGQYSAEDQCEQTVGTFCDSGDLTCGGDAVKLSLYYINSNGQCVLAPHNPYSPIGNSGGSANQQLACLKDTGQNCYVSDSTCGGAGSSDTVTMNGEAYKVTTASELIQNSSSPGFAGNGGSVSSLVAVKGTIKDILPETNKGVYDLVINTGDGYVVSMQSTIDPNTQASNGFYPASFPAGTKVIVGGAFIGGNLSVKTLETNPGVPGGRIVDPKLVNLNLPANTSVLSSLGGDAVQAVK